MGENLQIAFRCLNSCEVTMIVLMMLFWFIENDFLSFRFLREIIADGKNCLRASKSRENGLQCLKEKPENSLAIIC